MSGNDADVPNSVLKPNERILMRVPHPSRSDNLKTLRVIASFAVLGVAVALFAYFSRGDGSWILTVLSLLIGPYLFWLWLRSARTQFVLTDRRALRIVGDNVTDEFGWQESERPILLDRGKPVSDDILTVERKFSAASSVCLRLRDKRPFSWKRYFAGGDSGRLLIPNRSEGASLLEVLETSKGAWEAAQ